MRKIYKCIQIITLMEMKTEMVTIPKEKYEEMRNELMKLKKLEQIDFDLLRQFKESLEDIKAGRIKRVA